MCYNQVDDVVKEKSCGAIVYKNEKDKLEFLLVYQHNGHYSFPKGHVEENETEIETALREIKEETNLDVEIDSSFRHQITYFIESKNVIKDAVYFVATPKTNDLKPQEGEISECGWYSYEDTLEKLEFDNIKEVFENAYNYIKNKNI
ncbi:MAG: NUDIX domain-containing protein [Bacilli bacterium]|nr:NUDIX domain-containing protein [Bacilli bacterium]